MARSNLNLRKETLGLEIGHMKLFVAASGGAEAESWGSLAVWPLFPVEEAVGSEKSKHTASRLVGISPKGVGNVHEQHPPQHHRYSE